MKILTAILFVIGAFFAVFAWILVPTPIGIFIPEYEYKTYDVILSLTGSLTSLVGYYVWIGWGYFTLKGRYLLLPKKKFWSVSFLQHSAWLFVFPYMGEESVWVYLGSSEMILWKVWILGNITLSIICIFLRTNDLNQKAEQGNKAAHTTLTSAPS